MIKSKLILASGCSLLGALLWAEPVDIQIDRSTEKYNLGLSEFVMDTKDLGTQTPHSIHGIIAKDLEFSRLFNLVKEGPVVKGTAELPNWKQFGSQMVVGGKIKGRAGDELDVTAQLYDLTEGKVALNIKEHGDSGDLRIISHRVANQIVKYFTGQPGIFTSKLVFVNDSTGRKELYMSDFDGNGRRKLTNDNSIVILPRVSIDGTKMVFTSYSAGNPDLYFMNTDGTGRRKLSSKAGLNVSPSWSPNNRELAVTLSIDGPPNIYLMDLNGRVIRRLTDGKGADTAPAFSPDGTQIAFTSDRAGAPHIYVMGLDGTGLRRLTTDGHCDSSAWSPDGKTLVYVKGKGRDFDIYSIEVLTGIERRLTWGEEDNENPAWAPDSRTIIFISTRRGKSELYSMAADGSEQRPLIDMKGKSFTPHWSQ